MTVTLEDLEEIAGMAQWYACENKHKLQELDPTSIESMILTDMRYTCGWSEQWINDHKQEITMLIKVAWYAARDTANVLQS